MEIKGATLLYTLAGLSITFAGFSALLLAIRQAAGARLSALDRYLAKTVLTHLFLLTAGALMPPLLALYGAPEAWIWRGAALLFGLPMLLFLATYRHRRRKAVGNAPPPAVFAVFVVLGAAALIAMMISVWAGFEYSAATYITALTINFFTIAFAFVIAMDVIMAQPAGADGEAA
ncbi:MAG TPA: hypothetical protein VKS78_04590 [Roseiarcus sp.]|nr:hypothetical protein [Roseiarcus sp.]